MAPNSMFQGDVDPMDMSWTQRLKLCRFYRHAVKKSYGDAMTNLQVIKLKDTSEPVVIGLGGGDTQTVIYANIPSNGCSSNNGSRSVSDVRLKPFFSSEPENESAQPSAEAQLFYERMRSHVVSGLTGFSIHPDGCSILLSSLTSLKILNNGNVKPVAEWFSGTMLNAHLCPSDPELVSFCSSGQLYLDYKNTKLFSTTPGQHHTHGVASFIAQEELERFEGYWWNPHTAELLYEEVDESCVPQLSFECPGKKPSDLMRYPLTGSTNPISRLALISIDKSSQTVTQNLLPFGLKELFPWFEYLVRAGWTNADYCYGLLMNRTQTRQALVLFDKKAFTARNLSADQLKNEYIHVVYEEQSDIWLNFNYLIHFLPRQVPEIQFLFGSEKSDFCHLYLHTIRLKDGVFSENVAHHSEVQVTSGHWPVIKEAPLCVDEKRCQIYYLANQISPLLTSLCVSSYCQTTESKILMPPDLCYRQERGQFNLNINPEVGFVAWVSSVHQMPECRLYRLIQGGVSPSAPLPEAVFQCRLKLEVPLLKSPAKESFENEYSNVNLLDLFEAIPVEYKSEDSGYVHQAMVFLPTLPAKGDGYPIIHHVYAGPSVQQVRNNWQNVAQFLRFLSVGYAVVVVDGRGSSNRGVRFEGAIKNNLGAVEMKDQVEGLKQCITQVQSLDSNRIAVTGWSYGGYMALLLLSNYPRLYRAACAGGAVTDWTLYDTCYTERYMDLPKDNPAGYKTTAIIKSINKFPDEEGRLLIVHGFIDENVHFHHTEQLVNALITAGKPFEQLTFPSERHGIRQGTAIEFFHARQLSFFAKAFK